MTGSYNHKSSTEVGRNSRLMMALSSYKFGRNASMARVELC